MTSVTLSYDVITHSHIPPSPFISHTSDTIICVLPRSSSPTKHRRHHHRWSLIQITGSSTTDDAQITKNEKSSLQKNSTGKKTQIGKQTIVLRFFSLILTPCVLIPAARIVTRGYAPLGVTAACVFPAPFRAQYLLEYCFSWMRSWVRAFRFLYESFAESKKNIVIALLLISWNDETLVSANICENQTCIGVGLLQNKKTHARAYHLVEWPQPFLP